MAKFAPPPGTADIFPEESGQWRRLERVASGLFSRYGYGELRTPIFEYTEVFQRGLGNETEVVKKEMYTFQDRGGRSLTLRPEGTAGVMRALAGTDAINGVEQRVFYCGPMFRGERPAAGRRRQFHQIGVENVGRVAPELDAECIAMLMHFLNELGIDDAELAINTRGVASDRPAAEALLRDHFAEHLSAMCPDCQERFQSNIWRILDCKCPECREIIAGLGDYAQAFSAETRAYFDRVRRTLDALEVPYRVESSLVRGLDYYVHTVWEVSHGALGGQSAVAGGGRYELTLPGETRPLRGVGFAAGVERLMMILDAKGCNTAEAAGPLWTVAPLGDAAVLPGMELAEKLRRAGHRVNCEVETRSMKALLRSASKNASSGVFILGGDELARGTVQFKNFSDGSQREIPLSGAAELLEEFI